MDKQMQFTAKTFHGLENVLANELKKAGAEDIIIIKRGVRFKGDIRTMYKSNYTIRTALKILWEIKSFKINSSDDLYENIKAINWDEYFDASNTISIDKTVYSEIFQNTQFAALRAKDAIADYFREKYNTRPDVDKKMPDVKIDLHVSNKFCDIAIDTSGQSLFKRGYRKQSTIAPLNEVLAAGIILLTDKRRIDVLHDPMCGSGTILIEAASIYLNRPPQYRRKHFGFMKLKNYRPSLWREIKEEADSGIKEKMFVKISGSDYNTKALQAARVNIANAHLSDYIDLSMEDFRRSEPKEKKGTIITNPPYDIRIKDDKINKLYNDMGKQLKHYYKNWNAVIFSGNPDALTKVKLKPEKKIQLFNGNIKCSLNFYKLF